MKTLTDACLPRAGPGGGVWTRSSSLTLRGGMRGVCSQKKSKKQDSRSNGLNPKWEKGTCYDEIGRVDHNARKKTQTDLRTKTHTLI